MNNCQALLRNEWKRESNGDTYPTSRAPRNSVNEAMTMACGRVKDRDETDVAKELATSLAPMFHASRKAKIMPKAKM